MAISTDAYSHLVAHLGTGAANELKTVIERVSSQQINTVIATGVGDTLTAAGIAGGVISRSGPVANFSDPTDTGAAITAASGNSAWQLTVRNLTAWQQTITAGVGVTLAGLTPQIAGNCMGRFLVTSSGGLVTMTLLWVSDLGIDNLSAITDPGVGNDNTQGYGPGSLWFNTTLSRSWECLSNATGAAAWIFSGAVPGVGYEPNNVLAQAGGGTGVMPPEGNINKQSSLAGIGNGADTTDDVLFTYTLPANSLDQANREVTINAYGHFAANSNNKRVKLWFGATVVADTGALVGAAANGFGWQLTALITKVGAGGTNTQKAQGQQMSGTTHGGCTIPANPTEVESGGIVIKVTGSSYTSGVANDVLGEYMSTNFMN